MDKKGITVNCMAELTDVQHRIIRKYYEQKAVRFDLEILAKFCFVLKCDIADILYYQPPIAESGKGK
jgi:putative transcriptional regulator